MVQPLWRIVWRFFKNLKTELPYDPAILLLGIYPEKDMVQRDIFTPVFFAALFAISRILKQPKGPLTGEWVKKIWYNEILLRHKKGQN